MHNDYIITTLEFPVSLSDINAINALYAELAQDHPHQATHSRIASCVRSETSIVVIARLGGRIVGMASLFIVEKMTYAKGLVEDVAVDGVHHGQGLGNMLLEHTIAIATERGLAYVQLTSKPSRIAANQLYERFGFRRIETNFWRLPLL